MIRVITPTGPGCSSLCSAGIALSTQPCHGRGAFSRHTHKNGALLQHYCYDSIHPDGVKLQAPGWNWVLNVIGGENNQIEVPIKSSSHLCIESPCPSLLHCSCSTAARRNEKWHSYHLGHFQYFSPTVVAAYAEWQFWSKLTVWSKLHRRIWNLNLQLLLLCNVCKDSQERCDVFKMHYTFCELDWS